MAEADQMVNREAPKILTMPFPDAESGFMRDDNGRIFFLFTHGRQTLPFPVLSDGTIRNEADLDVLLMVANQKVELVHPKDLGITAIKWAE